MPAQVALINNAVTPYRIHLHARLVHEMPEVVFSSVFTHEVSNADWRIPIPADIRPVSFGPGEKSLESHHGGSQLREWHKGGRIIQWLREKEIRAVVLGGYSDAGRLRILAWCSRNQLPCFLFGDSNIRCDRSPWTKRAVLPHLLRLCDGVLSCGSLGDAYFQRYGMSSRRIFRFPYEPDYNAIRNMSTGQVDHIRQTFHLREDRRYIIYSGRVVAIKRIDLLLSAFFRISERRPEWDLIIAGDGPERPVLEQGCQSAQKHNRVIWIGFLNEPDRLAALYAACSLLVLPSDVEPWGVVVTEAAVRMPVIASSVVGAAADVIQDGINGRIFTTGSLESLTECLWDATDPARLEQMTAAVPVCFSKWHAVADPVAGLRSALRSMHVI